MNSDISTAHISTTDIHDPFASALDALHSAGLGPEVVIEWTTTDLVAA